MRPFIFVVIQPCLEISTKVVLDLVGEIDGKICAMRIWNFSLQDLVECLSCQRKLFLSSPLRLGLDVKEWNTLAWCCRDFLLFNGPWFEQLGALHQKRLWYGYVDSFPCLLSALTLKVFFELADFFSLVEFSSSAIAASSHKHQILCILWQKTSSKSLLRLLFFFSLAHIRMFSSVRYSVGMAFCFSWWFNSLSTLCLTISESISASTSPSSLQTLVQIASVLSRKGIWKSSRISRDTRRLCFKGCPSFGTQPRCLVALILSPDSLPFEIVSHNLPLVWKPQSLWL